MKKKNGFKRWIINTLLICSIVGVSVYYSTGKGVKVFNSALASNNSVPVHSIEMKDKTVAITINTGFSHQYTQEILNLFEKEGVKATFFTMGSWIDMYKIDAQNIHKKGHELGNNTLTYPHISHLSRENLEMEIQETDKKIKSITGKESSIFRPPYGEYSDKSQRVVNDMGKISVVWSIDAKDFNIEEDYEASFNKISSGSILLFDNNSKESLDKMEKTIKYLKGEGYKFKTLSEVLYKDSYYIDHTGRQKSI